MSEISKNAKAMYELRQQGITLEEIGKRYGVTRQAAYQTIKSYKRKVNGYRGYNFHVNEIVYQGIYDYFVEHMDETVGSFMEKIYGYNGKHSDNFKRWVRGDQDMYLPIDRIRKICEIVGKTFEETFKERKCYE